MRLRRASGEEDLEAIELEPTAAPRPSTAPELDHPAHAPERAAQPAHTQQRMAPLPRWMRKVGSRRSAWAVAGVAVAFALGAALQPADRGAEPVDAAEVQRIADASVGEAIENLRDAPEASAEVYDVILPSLVVIQRPGQGESSETGLGTGVVIDADGGILTSLHVVAGADRLDLTFSDGTRTTGRVESSDAANDIAVVTPDELPGIVVPAILGGAVDIGDQVIAVGHPLGLVASLSAGVVSGLDRSAPVDSGQTLDRLIQFDAAVNPGNSGGPLLDRNGRVVGIVTALANPSDQKYFIGIGFAVPIATAGGAAGAPPR